MEKSELIKHTLNMIVEMFANTPSISYRLRLIGAFALYYNLENIGVSSPKFRVTKDLDFDYFGSEITENDYRVFKQGLAANVSARLGAKVEFRPLTSRPKSATFKFKVTKGKVTTDWLKVDLSYVGHQPTKFINSLQDSLVQKLKVSFDKVDRRFKDKIDLFLLLQTLYPNGVRKGDILNLLNANGVNVALNPDWYTREGYDLLIRAATALKPDGASSTISNVDVAKVIRQFIIGLDDPSVNLNWIFKNGGWVND